MENKEKLKTRIYEFVNGAVDKADMDGSIEHFELEIKIHQEKLNMNIITKKRERLY